MKAIALQHLNEIFDLFRIAIAEGVVACATIGEAAIVGKRLHYIVAAPKRRGRQEALIKIAVHLRLFK